MLFRSDRTPTTPQGTIGNKIDAVDSQTPSKEAPAVTPKFSDKADVGNMIDRIDKDTKTKTPGPAPVNEISAELVGKVSNARFNRGEAPSKTLSRAIAKKFIASGKKLPEQPPFTGSHKRSHEKSSTHVHRLALKGMKSSMEEDANRPDRDLEAKTYSGATEIGRAHV